MVWRGTEYYGPACLFFGTGPFFYLHSDASAAKMVYHLYSTRTFLVPERAGLSRTTSRDLFPGNNDTSYADKIQSGMH